MPRVLSDVHLSGDHYVGRTFHRVILYGTACDEAILTYVPEDLDGIVHAHMWIGGGCYASSVELTPRTVFITGFPGRGQWYGDILVLKHLGHDPKKIQSMSFEEKALMDAILSSQIDLKSTYCVGFNRLRVTRSSHPSGSFDELVVLYLTGSLPLFTYHHSVLPNSLMSMSN
ncbi:hypothetical protein EV424DRAFT_1352391 [Suillus variegatus]|nr:hypothetical protein EV424DRAFT_1352391 [Suillus variegatus]